MAIKGKTKTRRPHGVTAAPRPQMVVRKPPFYRRRWVQVVAGLVILAIIGSIVGTTILSHQSEQFKVKEADGVTSYSSAVQSALPLDVRSVGGTTVVLFPDLNTSLGNLQSGKASAADSLKAAKAMEDQAKKAANALSAVSVYKYIPTSFTAGQTADMRTAGLTQLTLSEAQTTMAQALQIYVNIGALWQEATGLHGSAQAAVITQIKSLAIQAQQVFSSGFQTLQAVRGTLGLGEPAPLTPPTTLPPSPTATPKA